MCRWAVVLLVGLAVLAPVAAVSAAGVTATPEAAASQFDTQPAESTDDTSGTLASPERASRAGGAAELSLGREREHLGRLPELTSRFDVSDRRNVFHLIGSDGERTVVFTDDQPRTASATVVGTLIRAENAPGFDHDVIVASGVVFGDDTNSVTADDLRSNPADYRGQLVRIELTARQVSYTATDDSGAVSEQATYAARSRADGSLGSPASNAVFSVSNLSAEYGRQRTAAVFDRVDPRPDAILLRDHRGERFWSRGTRTVTGVVELSGSGRVVLHVARQSYRNTSVESVAELQRRGAELNDSVVSFTASVSGQWIGASEQLQSVAGCGIGGVTVGANCVSVSTDATLFAGVAFDDSPSDRSEAVVLAGLSNRRQSARTQNVSGTYQIVGRVVPVGAVDSSLSDGHALVVYRLDQGGDLSTRDDDAITAVRDPVVETIRAGVVPPEVSGAESTPTATDTASDTPTEMATTESSDTPTETATTANRTVASNGTASTNGSRNGTASTNGSSTANGSTGNGSAPTNTTTPGSGTANGDDTGPLALAFLGLWSLSWIGALGSEGLRQLRRMQGYVVTRTARLSVVLYGVGVLTGTVGLAFVAGGFLGLSFFGVNLLGIGAAVGVQVTDAV